MSTQYNHELIAVINLGKRHAGDEGLSYGINPNAGVFDAACAPLETGPLSDLWLNVAVRESFAPILSATAKGVLSPTTITPIMSGNDLIGEDYLDANDHRLGGWRYWRRGAQFIYPDPFQALASMGLVSRSSFEDDALIQAAMANEPVLSELQIQALHLSIDAELNLVTTLLGGSSALRSMVGIGQGLAKIMGE